MPDSRLYPRKYRSMGVRTNFRRRIIIFPLIASSGESIEFLFRTWFLSFEFLQNSLLSLLFRSRKFKTKHVVSIIRIVHVYIQHTALSPCNRSLSQQFSALVFPGLRRPIPREFPPDLIARARARVHQTFQDLYFIFNIARVAPAMIYFHQLANRVLSNHPLGSESIHLYSYIDPFIENGTSVPCIFFTDFSSVRPPLRPLRKSGNKYLFP